MSNLLPIRRSPRLQGYDYAHEGAYFVTICTHQRELLFGDVVNDEMRLSPAGKIAREDWEAIPQHYPTFELDAFVIMPNHVHGILVVTTPVGAGLALTAHPQPIPSLSQIIGGYKAGVTRRIRSASADDLSSIWQRSFHDHIIRDEADLLRIQQYVAQNPARWSEDRFFK